MNDGTRACIALVASRVVTGKTPSHIYDYSASRYRSITGSISGLSVQLFDHDRGCHFAGTLPQLFDYGTSAHIQLVITGNSFSGFDYGSSSHFSGTVNSLSISIFDYEKSAYFQYRG